MNVAGIVEIKLNIGFLPEYDTQASVSSQSLDVDLDVKIGWENHRKYQNKKTLHFEISRLDFDVDFSYSFNRAVTSTITDFFDETKNNTIKLYLKSAMKEQLLPLINTEINNQFNELPIFIPVFNDALIDYSLLEPPRLENDLLIIKMKASLITEKPIKRCRSASKLRA